MQGIASHLSLPHVQNMPTSFSSLRRFRRVSLVITLLAVPAVGAQPPVTASVSGAFTDEQAARGEKVFGGKCAECHEKKDVTNPDFRKKWNGRTARDLYELIRTTMPDDNPGSMTPDEYLDIVTYLVADSTTLSATKLDFPPTAAPPSQR